MGNYYSESLNANKLYDVYQTRIDRVRQYLDSEIEFVRKRLSPGDTVFEMGAGYGRIMERLARDVKYIHGVDISENSVAFGQEYLKSCPNCRLSTADIYEFDGGSEKYDAVLCLQNGLSAFRGNAERLVELAMNMLRTGGKAYFSSYSPDFQAYRLAWFEEQAEKGLLGEIDREKTRDGVIVCRDGFRATTFSADDMEKLGKSSGHGYSIQETDNSSVFLIVEKQRRIQLGTGSVPLTYV